MLKFEKDKYVIEQGSDFKVSATFTNSKLKENTPFRIRFFDENGSSYEVYNTGEERQNCVIDGDKVKMIFTGYNFSEGRLKYTQFLDIEDSDFPDGERNTRCTHYSSIYICRAGEAHECVCEDDEITALVSLEAISGLSAYEIAVKDGFKGTEEEWLDSLGCGEVSEQLEALRGEFDAMMDTQGDSLDSFNKIVLFLADYTKADTLKAIIDGINAGLTKDEADALYQPKGAYALKSELDDKVSVDDAVGERTPDGGEIFNGARNANSFAHAEGTSTNAAGNSSHAEGFSTEARGNNSHSEGQFTIAQGENSHSEGQYTKASGDISHVEGFNTLASSNFQHVQGKYNIEDNISKYADIVGWGDGPSQRKNIETTATNGVKWVAKDIMYGGTSQDDRNAISISGKFSELDWEIGKKANAIPVQESRGMEQDEVMTLDPNIYYVYSADVCEKLDVTPLWYSHLNNYTEYMLEVKNSFNGTTVLFSELGEEIFIEPGQTGQFSIVNDCLVYGIFNV